MMTDATSGWPIGPGSRVRLRTSVWDGGTDHHPPGWLGQPGDVLHVHGLGLHAIAVSHSPNPCVLGAFSVHESEVELHWEQPDLFPHTLPTKKEKYQ